ncbi:MAG: MerR family transcriptional regulator [Terriglobales bacterium]
MRIGELARLSGTTVPTLRYYEREGILPQPLRTPTGYRAYTARDLEQVRFLKRCQKLGFSLADIQRLAAMHGLTPRPCPRPSAAKAEFVELSRRRLEYLDRKIDGLRLLRRQVAALLRDAELRPSGCPAGR